MKTHILPIALAAGLLALPAAGFAAEPPGQWFVGGQVGQSQLQGMSANNDTDTGYAFSGGYRWMVNPDFEIGPELGYAKLGTFSDNFFIGAAPTGTVDAKVEGAFAGANARFYFSPNWYAQMQLGYFDAHNRINIRDSGALLESDKITKSSWYSGIGFGYQFSNNASLGFVYNHFDDNTSNYDLGSGLASIRVEFQF